MKKNFLGFLLLWAIVGCNQVAVTDPPKNLTARMFLPAAIEVVWVGNPSVNYYIIERATKSGDGTISDFIELRKSFMARFYDGRDIVLGQKYVYRVRSKTGDVYSEYSSYTITAKWSTASLQSTDSN